MQSDNREFGIHHQDKVHSPFSQRGLETALQSLPLDSSRKSIGRVHKLEQ